MLLAISVPADVKDLLYSAIDEIGREKIRMDIASDVYVSEKYCIEIITKCKSRLGSEADDEALATLCEALLHFMLTASLLPSERKVSVRGADLDVIIPSIRILTKSPEKSLVIQVIRENDLGAKVKQAESIQPHSENIWLVSAKELKTSHRNYHLGPMSIQYSHIVPDISTFLAEKGGRGLRLLH
jgi:hypothetical protein